jgi:hypothetical protein
MRSNLRCRLACLLCILLPSVGHAGPIGDSLRDVSAKQAATAPGKSRQRVWVGGIVLTVVGGILIIVGESQTRDNPDFGTGCESAGIFGCSPRLGDPNNALIGAGAAAVGAGIIMIILGRTRPAPQIIATPGKFAVQHTVTF